MHLIINYKIFGANRKPTIYYLTGYGGKVIWFWPHIFLLMLAGFRVMAFEYQRAILNQGNPDNLITSLQDMADVINRDRRDRPVAGVYGISLGSWLGSNLLGLCDINSGLFNTGGVSIIKAIWTKPSLAEEKAAFEKQGYSTESLQSIWGLYDFNDSGSWLAGKRFILMSSSRDEVMDIEEVRHHVASWRKSNPQIQFIESHNLSHGLAILRSLCRLRQTISFFKRSNA